jgi:ATP-dependent DNA helicase DinG
VAQALESARRWWPKPAPASARPSPTWCRCCCRARALVSTATKSLQDQLFLRDLPRLRDALGVPCDGAAEGPRQLPVPAPPAAGALTRRAARPLGGAHAGAGRAWAQATRSGDLAEIEGLDERSPVIPLVTSTRDNCLGSECPQFAAAM